MAILAVYVNNYKRFTKKLVEFSIFQKIYIHT